MDNYQSIYPDSDRTINLNDLVTADNSLMWYAAALPFFGVIFEFYADSKYLGFFLWGLIIITRILVCRYDNKKLIKMGMWQSQSITPAVFLPVVYMFKRSKALRRSPSVGIVAVMCMLFALLLNGFTQSLSYNEENYCEFVSKYYATYILDLPEDENYVADSYNTIDGLLNSYCFLQSSSLSDASSISYEYEKDGKDNYVTAFGRKNGEDMEIRFFIDYDGFYYKGMEIDSVRIDGKELEGDELDEFLKEVFMVDLSEEEQDD